MFYFILRTPQNLKLLEILAFLYKYNKLVLPVTKTCGSKQGTFFRYDGHRVGIPCLAHVSATLFHEPLVTLLRCSMYIRCRPLITF